MMMRLCGAVDVDVDDDCIALRRPPGTEGPGRAAVPMHGATSAACASCVTSCTALSCSPTPNCRTAGVHVAQAPGPETPGTKQFLTPRMAPNHSWICHTHCTHCTHAHMQAQPEAMHTTCRLLRASQACEYTCLHPDLAICKQPPFVCVVAGCGTFTQDQVTMHHRATSLQPGVCTCPHHHTLSQARLWCSALPRAREPAPCPRCHPPLPPGGAQLMCARVCACTRMPACVCVRARARE